MINKVIPWIDVLNSAIKRATMTLTFSTVSNVTKTAKNIAKNF
jgi:hypothetical protein